MRFFITALVGSLLFLGLPALADDDDDSGLSDDKFPPTIKCTSYKTALEENIQKLNGIIPEPRYRARKSIPTDMLIENYDFVQAVIGCDDGGMFTGVGATLIQGNPKYEDLWKPFVMKLIQSIDKSYSDETARTIFNELEHDALDIARKSKNLGGPYMGGKSINIGNYWVYYTDGDRPKGFQIDLRYVPLDKIK